MNLIVCDQHCRHQEEGYCTLNQISRLTSDASAKCGYFEVQEKAVPPYGTAGTSLPKNP